MTQRPEAKNGGRIEVPGPGEYTFSNDTITMKQMHNVIKREEKDDKKYGTKNFKMLSKKVTIKPDVVAQEEKKELHLVKKEYLG